MSDDLGLRIGRDEQAGIAEAERLVKEAEFGARELGGWSFWLSGALALAMNAFQLLTAAGGAAAVVRPRPGGARRVRLALRHAPLRGPAPARGHARAEGHRGRRRAHP